MAGRARMASFASFCSIAVVFGIMGLFVSEVCADTHTSGTPQLSSLPGATYTIYLDFSGFNFTGTWGSSGDTPGNTPAFENAANTGTFSTSQQDDIKAVWARVAQCYTPFNVNVTTIDPAVAASKADTDAHRQAYYDQTAKLMHTVIGPQQNSWCGGYGGISYVGVSQSSEITSIYNSGAGAGWKTNWVFTDGVGTGVACGQAAAHENGHGLSLDHQADFTGTTYVNEYSTGNAETGNTGNGSYAPIMGAAYYTQRGAWRLGDDSGGGTQNDVTKLINNNSGMGGYINDGIGHTTATATALPLTGNSVNYAAAKGIITPTSTSSPTPIGVSNYTTDYFSFHSAGGAVTLTVYDGTEYLTSGTQDPGAMLRSTLTILNASGAVVGTATEAASTLSETFSGTLAAGTYYAKIASYGGETQTLGSYNTTYYYDMGSYFIKGSGLTVPEPGTLALLASVVCFGLAIRRRARARGK